MSKYKQEYSRVDIYLSELNKESKYFFANKVEHIEKKPVHFPNFSLWAVIEHLDTLTSKFTTFLTKSKGSSCYLIKVTSVYPFDFVTPKIFREEKQNDCILFYVPRDLFLLFEASHPCTPVRGNNWLNVSKTYNCLAAFYRLGVLPSLNQSTFSQDDVFYRGEELFYKYYFHGSDSPLHSAMQSLFKQIFFALRFFGFACPDDLLSLESFSALKGLYELPDSNDSNKTLFAFTEMKWMIKKYHMFCFPERDKDPEVFSIESVHALLGAIEFVRNSLTKPSSIEIKDIQTFLGDCIKNYQKQNGLQLGVCDMYTLRHLYRTTMSNTSKKNKAYSLDFSVLCRFCGKKYLLTPVPLQIPLPIPVSDNRSKELEQIENSYNAVIGQIRTHSDIPRWLVEQANEAIKSHETGLLEVQNRSNNISDKIECISKLANEQNVLSITYDSNLDSIYETVREQYEVQMKMITDLSVIKDTIRDLKHANNIMIILIAFLSITLISKLFR